MKITDDLLKQLEHLDIEEFKKIDCFEDITISDYLNTMLKDNGLCIKDVIVKLNMERSYTYQIFKGRRNPTRNFLIRLALLCKLSLDETQRMLTIGKRSILYPRTQFDAAVIYAIQHNLKEDDLNQLLSDIGDESII